MTLDLLLALGVLLSTASQLRPGDLPIGPGEICLAGWLLIMAGREVARRGPPLSLPLCRLLAFWVVFIFAECLGTLSGVFIDDRHDTGLFLHDVVAYLLVSGVSCLSVSEPGASRRLQAVARDVVVVGAILLGVQLVTAFVIPIGFGDPWYWDRFRGWSDNPNQLALLCAALVFLPVCVAEADARPRIRTAAAVCLILALWVGWITKSATFRIAVVAGIPVFFVVRLSTWVRHSGGQLTFRAAFVLIAALGLPLLVASAAPLSSLIHVGAGDLGKENSRNAEQEAQVRFNAWSEAIERGMQSGMLGLGPGPHLPIPPSILDARLDSSNDSPKYIEHPAPSAAPNFEAHNTVLDLFTQGGLLAVSVFVWLLATTFMTAYRARLAGLAALICSLGMFSTVHLIVRLPIFWFSVALCLVVGTEAGKASVMRLRS